MNKFEQKHPWLWHKIRELQWTGISSFYYRKLFQARLQNFDLRIWLYPKSSFSKRVFFKEYERETVQFFNRAIRPGDCIFDIGANIGFFSLLFSFWSGPDGQVHAFEPSLRELYVLCKNVEINKLHNIFINPLAVSFQTGYTTFHVFDKGEDGVYNSFSGDFKQRTTPKKRHQVAIRTIRLDDYCSLYKTKPSIVKIDTEGAEHQVIQGGEILFSAEDAPIIVYEECPSNLKAFNISPDDIHQLLTSFGYSLFQIQRDGHLKTYHPKMNESYSENIVAVKGYHLASLQALYCE